MLLSCSKSYSNDSIRVSISDIKYINERLIITDNLETQLNLYKILNDNNQKLITDITLECCDLEEENKTLVKKYNKEHKKVNIFKGAAGGLLIVLVIILI